MEGISANHSAQPTQHAFAFSRLVVGFGVANESGWNWREKKGGSLSAYSGLPQIHHTSREG